MHFYQSLALAAIPAIAISFSACSRDQQDIQDDIASTLEEIEEALADCDKDNTDKTCEKLDELAEKLSKLHYEVKNFKAEEKDELSEKEERVQKDNNKRLAKLAAGITCEIGFISKHDHYGSNKLKESLRNLRRAL